VTPSQPTHFRAARRMTAMTSASFSALPSSRAICANSIHSPALQGYWHQVSRVSCRRPATWSPPQTSNAPSAGIGDFHGVKRTHIQPLARHGVLVAIDERGFPPVPVAVPRSPRPCCVLHGRAAWARHVPPGGLHGLSTSPGGTRQLPFSPLGSGPHPWLGPHPS
jgi:hypothetical protein